MAETINNLYKNLGFTLLENGVFFIQKVYANLQSQIFPYGKIRETLNQYGLTNTVDNERDVKYAFLDYQSLEPILWDVMGLVHKFKYKLEFTDCDNFAELTSSLISFLYGINTCGYCWGDVYDRQTGKFMAGHYFNLAISCSPIYKKFELWLCDSLNPMEITKIEKNTPIIIGDWEYRNLRSVTFF